MRASGSFAARAALFAALLALAACSKGPDDAPAQGAASPAPAAAPKHAKKEDPGRKAAKPDPAPKPPEAKGPEAKAPEERPGPDAPPAVPARKFRLEHKFHGEERLAWQVRYESESARAGSVVDRVRVDGTRFLLCAGPGGDEGTWRLIRENPAPVEEIAGGKPSERRAGKDIAFLLLDGRGRPAAGREGLPEGLLLSMGDLRLPPGEVAEGDAWSEERDALEGRFLFRYRAGGLVEESGRSCLEIHLSVDLPAGVPCGILSIENARATLRFDPEAGILASARAEAAFTRGAGAEALACRGALETVFFGKSPATPQEAASAREAAAAWFDLQRMLEGKMYARAQKRIDEFVDATRVAEYALAVDALRKRIPDTRRAPARGLLERKRFDFGALAWNPDSGPAIVLQDNGKLEEGKPRALDLAGKPAPAFWWKELFRGGDWAAAAKDFEGKALLVHVWASWIPPCAESVRKTAELAERLKEKPVRLLGITFDTERKDLDAFAAKLDLKHPTVWDEDQVSVKVFGLPGAPAFLVLDKGRVVRFAEMGWFGEKTLERIAKALEDAAR